MKINLKYQVAAAFLLTGLTMLFMPQAHADGGVALWTNRYCGPLNEDDRPFATAVDNKGNVAVTGYSSNGTNYDIATVEYSSEGVPLWTNRYNGPANGDDEASAVAMDRNGNVFVTGYSWSGTSGDYATLAYSNSGVPLWTNYYGALENGFDHAYAIAVDSNDNVFVTGQSYGSTESDYATVAYSNAGVPLWTNRYDGPWNRYDRPSAIAVDKHGNVVVTGSSTDDALFTDYATVAYSNAGLPLWTNRYDGPGHRGDGARGAAIDSSGNVFVTGDTTMLSVYPYSSDFATLAYSAAGVPLWTNRYNGTADNYDAASGVAVDSIGTVFVAGFSWSGTSYDYVTLAYSNAGLPLWTNSYNGPGNGSDWTTAVAVDSSENVIVTGYSSNGTNDDYATIAYSNNGLPLWTNRYNGPGNGRDQTSAFALDNSGNVIVTGYSAGTNGYGTPEFATIKYSSSVRSYLGIQNINNQVVLTWTNSGFRLQSTSNSIDTFFDIPGATSPYTNTIIDSQQYFRLIFKLRTVLSRTEEQVSSQQPRETGVDHRGNSRLLRTKASLRWSSVLRAAASGKPPCLDNRFPVGAKKDKRKANCVLHCQSHLNSIR